MTATTASAAATTRGSRRGVVIGITLAFVVLLVAVLAGRGSPARDEPLSPASTSPDGLRGLVLLLGSFGADVRTGQRVPDAATRVALLVRDSLDDASRDDLRAWVERGGTLVVADARSPLASRTSGTAPRLSLPPGTCDLAGLDDVGAIRVGGITAGALDPAGGDEYRVAGGPSCFGDGTDAYVVAARAGAGTIVSIGAPNVFANAYLDQADDSVLAMRLLQPDHAQPVALLRTNVAAAGRTSLFDLISDRVWQALAQLAIAFVLYALWRARRLGRPVLEPQQVAIAGSALVRAVGTLEQRTHAAPRAAAAIRNDTARVVRERYGLGAGASASLVADVVAARTGLDRDRVARALHDVPVTDEPALVAVTHELDTIRKEVLHGTRR